MNTKSGPEIRNDDVLQMIGSTTAHQRKDLDGRTLFECFLEADEIFEKYNYPCILAVLAEGIKFEPEWVNHIIKNKHRYRIELHGLTHKNYRNISYKQFMREMQEAIDLIQETFEVKITMWYPPWGRKGERITGVGCTRLGIKQYRQIGKVDAKFWFKNPDKYPHVNFHYWNKVQIGHVKRIFEVLH